MTDEERVADFARVQLARYSEYHAHKESMAYAGLALFAGVVGAILVIDKWPPETWGGHRKIFAFIALSLAWTAVLIYLHFQLRRRRWAALRVAACERVLAMWATKQFRDPSDLVAAYRESSAKVMWFYRFFDFVIFPLKRAVKAIDQPKSAPPKSEPIYPRVFVSALEQVEENGTEAIYHERLMHVTGWVLYCAAIVRTVAA
jgi:hypothetical protein